MINVKLLFIYLFFIINIFNSSPNLEYLKTKQKNSDLIALIDSIDKSDLNSLMQSDSKYYSQHKLFFFNLRKYIKSKEIHKNLYIENYVSLRGDMLNNILSKCDKKELRYTLFLIHKKSINNKEDLDIFISQEDDRFKKEYTNEIKRLIESEKRRIERQLQYSERFFEDFYSKIIQQDYSIIWQLSNTIHEIFNLVSNSDFLTDFEKNTLFENNSYLLQNFFKLVSLLLYKRDIQFYYYIDIYLNLLQKKINRMNHDNLQHNLSLLLFDSGSEYFYCQNKKLYEVYFNKLKKILLQYYKYCGCEHQYSDLLKNRKKFQQKLLIYKINEIINKNKNQYFDFFKEDYKRKLFIERLMGIEKKLMEIETRIKRECFDDFKENYNKKLLLENLMSIEAKLMRTETRIKKECLNSFKKYYEQKLFFEKLIKIEKKLMEIETSTKKEYFDVFKKYDKQKLFIEKLMKIEARIKRECFNDIRKIKKFSLDDALDMLDNATNKMQSEILPISTINMEDIKYLNERISNFNNNNISREIQAMLDSLEI
jgi:hypothetical protein